MPLPVIALLVIQCVVIVCLIVLAIQGFRTDARWGLFPLLILLGPTACASVGAPGFVAAGFVLAGFGGLLAFAIKHPRRAGVLCGIYAACFVTTLVMMFTSPAVIAFCGRFNPRLGDIVKTVNPSAYDAAQKVPSFNLPGVPDNQPKAKPTPHEVRDLAENETPLPAPRADPNAAQRAAYTKHAAQLGVLYQQLNAERGKLKPGTSAALTAFNAKAAKYSDGIKALTEEKTKLDALDRAANLPADAAAALASLQASSAAGDYEAFAATLKKSLDEYRQTPSFPAITALARTTLAQATDDKVAAGVKDKAAKTARADFDKTTRQIQGIVNQTPAIVGHPPAGAEVYHYAFHPGANPPDYKAENLKSTQEIWKGQYAYMDEAPGVFYQSADCEFNPQLKCFYTSRNVPKKRLNDTEYQDLTRLLRQLGQQEKALANAAPPAGLAERVTADLATLKSQLDGYAMK